MAQHTPGTLNIVDLSQADRRVTPKLTHDIILGDPTRAVGERAGVRQPPSLKKPHRRRWRDRQFVCAEQPGSGKPVVGHERQS